jgi:hypothetical protein
LYDYNCSGPFSYCGTVTYKFQGDTIFQNISYHKLYSQIWPNTSFNYVCAIREDSVTKKIFTHQSNCGSSDTLLYDFKLLIDDTISVCPQISGDSVAIIQSIDSVLILSQWIKKINLINGSSIIENIGSTGGLIGPWGGWIGGSLQLNCFILNSFPVFPNNCSVNNVLRNNYESNFSIYSEDKQIRIRFHSENSDLINLEIFKMDGKVIYKKCLGRIIADQVFYTETEFNSGLYLVKIFNHELVYVVKLFIE